MYSPTPPSSLKRAQSCRWPQTRTASVNSSKPYDPTRISSGRPQRFVRLPRILLPEGRAERPPRRWRPPTGRVHCRPSTHAVVAWPVRSGPKLSPTPEPINREHSLWPDRIERCRSRHCAGNVLPYPAHRELDLSCTHGHFSRQEQLQWRRAPDPVGGARVRSSEMTRPASVTGDGDNPRFYYVALAFRKYECVRHI